MNSIKVINLGFATFVALLILGGGMLWSAISSSFWPVGIAVFMVISMMILFRKKIFSKLLE